MLGKIDTQNLKSFILSKLKELEKSDSLDSLKGHIIGFYKYPDNSKYHENQGTTWFVFYLSELITIDAYKGLLSSIEAEGSSAKEALTEIIERVVYLMHNYDELVYYIENIVPKIKDMPSSFVYQAVWLKEELVSSIYKQFGFLYTELYGLLKKIEDYGDYYYRGEHLVKSSTAKIIDSDDKWNDIIDDINNMISGRTRYGLHKEAAKFEDATFLMWSNGNAAWFINRSETDRFYNAKVYRENLRNIKLDANEIIVPYHPEIVSQILPYLEQLPLYVFSLEGKAVQRGPGEVREIVLQRHVNTIVESIINEYFLQPGEEHKPEAEWVRERIYASINQARKEHNPAILMKFLDRIKIKLNPAFYGTLYNYIMK